MLNFIFSLVPHSLHEVILVGLWFVVGALVFRNNPVKAEAILAQAKAKSASEAAILQTYLNNAAAQSWVGKLMAWAKGLFGK